MFDFDLPPISQTMDRYKYAIVTLQGHNTVLVRSPTSDFRAESSVLAVYKERHQTEVAIVLYMDDIVSGQVVSKTEELFETLLSGKDIEWLRSRDWQDYD